MHQETMHVLLHKFGIDKVDTVKFFQHLVGEKLEIIIHDMMVLFFQFFSDVFDEWAPLGCRIQLWDKVDAYPWMFMSHQVHTRILHICEATDFGWWFNTSEKISVIVVVEFHNLLIGRDKQIMLAVEIQFFYR